MTSGLHCRFFDLWQVLPRPWRFGSRSLWQGQLVTQWVQSSLQSEKCYDHLRPIAVLQQLSTKEKSKSWNPGEIIVPDDGILLINVDLIWSSNIEPRFMFHHFPILFPYEYLPPATPENLERRSRSGHRFAALWGRPPIGPSGAQAVQNIFLSYSFLSYHILIHVLSMRSSSPFLQVFFWRHDVQWYSDIFQSKLAPQVGSRHVIMRPDLAAESDKLRLAGARRLGVSWGSHGQQCYQSEAAKQAHDDIW